MRILLVRHYRPDAQRSMIEFGEAIYGYLESKGRDVRSIEPTARLGKGKNTMAGKAKLLGYIDKFVLFPFELRRAAKQADVVHLCGQQHALYIKYLGGKPTLLTCHDLLAVRASLGEMSDIKVGDSGQKLQNMIRDAMPKAKRIACISQATLDDLAKYCRLKPNQGFVILNGLFEPISRMQEARADAELTRLGIDPDAKFLFHIGGNQFYKNRPGVVRIFAHLKQLPGTADLKLVMAGKPLPPDVKSLIAENGLEKEVAIANDISFEAKAALFSKAHALLFPSTFEGFGLPLIEAQSCGCPVITSDVAPMNEIVGDTGLLIDPTDEPGSAARIQASLDHLQHFIQPGYENVERFTIERMGADYERAYASL